MEPSTPFRELRTRIAEVLPSMPDGAAYARTLEWRMRVFILLQLSDFLVLIYAPWTGLKIVCAIVFAFYRARTAWTIIHERVHRAELPNTFAKVYFDFSTVFISRFWRAHHLQHHAHTNTSRDPDTHMFLGRDLNDARKGEGAGGLRRVVRFVTTLAQYPFFYALFLLRSLSTYKGGNTALYLATIFVQPALAALVLPRDAARLNAEANLGLGALYLVVTFAPTHTASKGNFDSVGDPMLDQLISSNDVWPRSRLWNFLCGGINAHIEHHLFPFVPFHQLRLIAPIVEAFARERGLPYNAYSPFGIWRAHLRFLWRS
jgi:fatty acid desaturase